jgi:hypothetical protein
MPLSGVRQYAAYAAVVYLSHMVYTEDEMIRDEAALQYAEEALRLIPTDSRAALDMLLEVAPLVQSANRPILLLLSNFAALLQRRWDQLAHPTRFAATGRAS